MDFIFYFFVYSTFCSLIHCQNSNVHISTTVGTIVGRNENVTFNRLTYNMNKFLGIPYAEAPVGDLRFARPLKKSPFFLPFQAERFGPACPQDAKLAKQWIPGEPDISEDCLSLNIFAPKSVHKLPVMIWLHGGAFVIGQSGIYSAERLAGFGNVVVVSVNYRLGPIGFLATDDDLAKGNYGLWDQQLAIQWVHDHIGHFGGDNTNITLFGESAGGASAIFQAMYPPNKGLFHRIIAESGYSMSPWSYGDKRNVGMFTKLLGLKLNCSVTPNTELLRCLRSKKFEELLKHSQVGTPEYEMFRPEWTPVVDGEMIKQLPQKAFQNPENIPADEKALFGEMDLLAGVNSGDGGFIASVGILPFVKSRSNASVSPLDVTNNYITHAMLIDTFGSSSMSTADVMSFIYTDWSSTTSNTTYLQKILDMSSDFQFFIPAKMTARVHNRFQQSGKHTYFYRFSHRSSYAHSISWVPGAGHGDELPYVFGFPESMKAGFGYTDKVPHDEIVLSNTMMTYWTNFAKTGTPNKPNPVPRTWPRFDGNTEKYLDFDTNIRQKAKMDPERTAFWTQLMPKLLKDLTIQNVTADKLQNHNHLHFIPPFIVG